MWQARVPACTPRSAWAVTPFRLRTGVYQQPRAQARAYAERGCRRRTEIWQSPDPRRHILLQPVLRSDRHLGGSLTTLSHYKSDNLANSRAQGAESRRACGRRVGCSSPAPTRYWKPAFCRSTDRAIWRPILRRGTTTRTPSRALRKCRSYFYAWTVRRRFKGYFRGRGGRGEGGLLFRGPPVRGAELRSQQRIVLEFRIRECGRQPELRPRTRRHGIRESAQCAQSPISGSVRIPSPKLNFVAGMNGPSRGLNERTF